MAISWLGWLAQHPGLDTSLMGSGGEKPDWGELVPPWSPNLPPWLERDIRRLLGLLGFPQFERTWSDIPPRPFGGAGSEARPGIYNDLLYRGPERTAQRRWSDIPPMPIEPPPTDPRKPYYPSHQWRGQWEGYGSEWKEDNFWTDLRWNSRIGRAF